jgi:Family of unknown function (DUF5689)
MTGVRRLESRAFNLVWLAAAILIIANSRTNAAYLNAFSGNCDGAAVTGGEDTINFAVLDRLSGASSAGDVFGTGFAGFDNQAVAGGGTGTFDTTARYLYLYQLVNAPASAQFLGNFGVSPPDGKVRFVGVSSYEQWKLFLADDGGVVSTTNNFGLDAIPFTASAPANVGVANPIVSASGSVATLNPMVFSAPTPTSFSVAHSPELQPGGISRLFGFTTNVSPEYVHRQGDIDLIGSTKPAPVAAPEPNSCLLFAIGMVVIIPYHVKRRIASDDRAAIAFVLLRSKRNKGESMNRNSFRGALVMLAVAGSFFANNYASAMTISAAKALPVGSAVTINSVVISTSIDLTASTASTTFNVQDATGGATVFGSNADITTVLTGLSAGDRINVSGTTSSFNGLFEIAQPSLATSLVTAAVGVPAPVLTTAADYQNLSANVERFESELVTLPNVHFTGLIANQTFAGSTNYIATDGINNVTVRVQTLSSSLVGDVIPIGQVNITGVLAEFDAANPLPGVPGNGYQLYLLDDSSIRQVPEPGALALATFACAVLFFRWADKKSELSFLSRRLLLRAAAGTKG